MSKVQHVKLNLAGASLEAVGSDDVVALGQLDPLHAVDVHVNHVS